eukprot:GHVU01057561.1.p1 GENE.GHVU01057561.1~~GHVU01057561.1.p1  ORF type:complete len:362 (+),score=39.77 GHVU01057561.1:936-2021(+)
MSSCTYVHDSVLLCLPDNEFAQVGEVQPTARGMRLHSYKLPGGPAGAAPAEPPNPPTTPVGAASSTQPPREATADVPDTSALVCDPPPSQDEVTDKGTDSSPKSWRTLCSVDRLQEVALRRRKAPGGAEHLTDSVRMEECRRAAEDAAVAAAAKEEERVRKHTASLKKKADKEAARRASARPVTAAASGGRKRGRPQGEPASAACVSCGGTSSGSSDPSWVQCHSCPRRAHRKCASFVNGFMLCGYCPPPTTAAGNAPDVCGGREEDEDAALVDVGRSKRPRHSHAVGGRKCVDCGGGPGDTGRQSWVTCEGCDKDLHAHCAQGWAGIALCLHCQHGQPLPGGRRRRGVTERGNEEDFVDE